MKQLLSFSFGCLSSKKRKGNQKEHEDVVRKEKKGEVMKLLDIQLGRRKVPLIWNLMMTSSRMSTPMRLLELI